MLSEGFFIEVLLNLNMNCSKKIQGYVNQNVTVFQIWIHHMYKHMNGKLGFYKLNKKFVLILYHEIVAHTKYYLLHVKCNFKIIW